MTESTEEKPPTISKRVDLLAAEVGKLTEDMERRNRPLSKPYTEADAIGACIRALDPIAEAERQRGGHTFAAYTFRSSAIERALRYLAAKYGVELVEVRTEPCGRAHIDSLDMSRVADAFVSAVSS